MSDVESDLRSLTENLAADAQRLQQIEEEKGRLHPASPRSRRLAREAERLTREMLPKAVAERELVEDAGA